MKTSQRQRVTFREKVTSLESQLRSIAASLDSLTTTVNALVHIAGPEAVRAAHQERATQDNIALLAAVEAGAKEGKLVPQEHITGESFVVATEYDPDGKEVPPGRFALVLGRATADVQAALGLEKVGPVMLGGGRVLFVEAIYTTPRQP